MAKIIGNPVGVPNPKTDWNQENESKADVVLNKPTKLSQFENDTQFVTDKHMHKTTDIATMFLEDGRVDATLADTLRIYDQSFGDLYPRVLSLEGNKADKSEVDSITGNIQASVDTVYDMSLANEQKIGDIETALDNIINIQNSLIGGGSV